MANVNAPYGFISNDNMLSDDAESLQQYSVLDTNTHPIGQGDPVSVLNTGTVGRSAAGDGDIVVGIVQNIFDSNGRPIDYLPASTAGTVEVTPVTSVNKFRVQCSGTVAATDVFATADFVASDCNTNAGLSTYQLDSTTIGTGNQCRILGLYNTVNNNWGTNAQVIVSFCENVWRVNTSV